MSDLSDVKENPRNAIWEELEDVRAVMLGAEGGGEHMQPMSPHPDKESGIVWFFTNADTDLAKAAVDVPRAKMCVIGSDRDFHACLSGSLSLSRDPEVIEEYWSPFVSAWFNGGKDDPKLALLAFEPTNAAIWASTDSKVRFGWEIAKANLTDDKPDVGFHTVVTF